MIFIKRFIINLLSTISILWVLGGFAISGFCAYYAWYLALDGKHDWWWFFLAVLGSLLFSLFLWVIASETINEIGQRKDRKCG